MCVCVHAWACLPFPFYEGRHWGTKKNGSHGPRVSAPCFEKQLPWLFWNALDGLGPYCYCQACSRSPWATFTPWALCRVCDYCKSSCWTMFLKSPSTKNVRCVVSQVELGLQPNINLRGSALILLCCLWFLYPDSCTFGCESTDWATQDWMTMIEPWGTDDKEPFLTLQEVPDIQGAQHANQVPEEFSRIPQGVHWICSSGWKY